MLDIVDPLTSLHPRIDARGREVRIFNPSQPSGLEAWSERNLIATAVPGQGMPQSLNGVSVSMAVPVDRPLDDWRGLVESYSFREPSLVSRGAHSPVHAGVVVLEPDGRIWVVSPTNQPNGYNHTFPRVAVRTTDCTSFRAAALQGVHEATGLEVSLVAYVLDSHGTQGLTRYYLARRLGGNPAEMGPDSQAVHLVPKPMLADFLRHADDQPILRALRIL